MFLFNLYISVICICFGFRTSNFVFLGSRHAESIYLRAYKALHLSRILYKSTTFMQNKPNSPNVQMNLNNSNKMNHKKTNLALSEVEWAKQTQFKPNLPKCKIDANCVFTKDYRKKDDFVVRINKPNSRKTQNERKRFFTKGL